MGGPLHVVHDDRGVVTLTLDRPQVKNAIDAELMRALVDTLRASSHDGDVRAIVITGSGDVFSSGADLTWMAGVADASFDDNVADARRFEAMLHAVASCPVPVLARVNGHAIAGAAGIVACADIVVAVRGARFGFTEVRLGLVPAMVSAYVLPRIGASHARRYLVTGELFDADRAYDIGLVHEVCDADALDATFAELLDHVLAAGPAAVRATKQLLQTIARSTGPADSEQLRVETIARARVSDEAQERMRAFLELRAT